MKREHFPIPYTKINSKWIKVLNIRPETMKFGFKSIRQWTEYTAEKILSNKEYDQGFKNYSVFLKFSSMFINFYKGKIYQQFRTTE